MSWLYGRPQQQQQRYGGVFAPMIDWFRERFSRPGIEPSGASVLTTSFGMDGRENILPFLMSNSYQAYGQNAVVFGAMLARLMLFSEATFAFRDLEDKSLSGSFEVDGRRAAPLSLLENPWPNGTTGELLARMIQDVDLAGNAYIWDAGEQLVRLRPDWITIVSELVTDPIGRSYRRVIGYWYEPPKSVLDAGDPAMYLPDEIAHWSPITDPWANFRGMSWLTPVLREIAADQAMTTYKIRYLENAASPNLLIKYQQNIGDETLIRIRDQMEDRHGGAENAFKTLVLDEGADAMIIGNTFEQMNFSTVQAAGENRIIIASGVPGIVIGSKEGLMAATYSNYEQAMRRFADLTMRPLWRGVCGCLSRLVAVPPRKRLWYDTTDIAALRQGEKERAETVLIKAQAAKALVEAHFTADTVTVAVEAGELSGLKWEAPPEPAPANGQNPSGNGQIASGDASKKALVPARSERYNPRQPRDKEGQWTSGVGGAGLGASLGSSGDAAAAASARLHATASKHVGEITGDVQASVPEGAELVGLHNALKKPESLERKIRTDAITEGISPDKAAAKISDSVRFTQISPPNRMAADANQTLDGLRGKGYDVSRVKNTWQNTSGNPYQGINAKVRHRSGLEVEMQFHTPESLEVKNRIHKVYEKQRTMTTGWGTSPEWTALNDQMTELSAGLTVPKDVHTVR